LIGRSDGDMAENLKNFSRALGAMTSSPVALKPPSSWSEAFLQLESVLNRLRTKKKIVIFFDEFPWLDSPKSGFLSAFEHFWNNWAVNKSNLACVICGSAAAWMIRKVVSQKGGLYNRVTRKIHLKPFTLAEVESYIKMLGVSLNRHQVAELYLSLGGIPFYYKYGKKSNAALYRIVDEFTLFYLKWMKPAASAKQRSKSNRTDWNQIRNTPAWHAWAGYTFENICWKHIQSIKQQLQIGALKSNQSPWQISSSDSVPKGAQIDLLIDRRDDVINLCEMKYTQTPFVIDKAYTQDLLRKIEVFRDNAKVPARCSIVLTMISALGIEPNQYMQQLNPIVLDIDALFNPSV